MQPPQPQPYQQPFAYPGQPPYPQQGSQPVNVVNVHTHVQQSPTYAPPPIIVHNTSHTTAHVIHLVLTIVTCGMWAPFWIIHAIIIAASKPKTIYPVAPMPVAPFMPMAPAPGPGFASGVPMNRNQEALAMVAQQNGKRAEARQLAAADPMSARQLGIGRRDLPERRYDDGGLIDINRVPAEIFTHFSGITSDKAAHIIIVRDSLGGAFSSVEELMATADLPPHLADDIAEYAIVIR